jgi:hypothetical protein
MVRAIHAIHALDDQLSPGIAVLLVRAYCRENAQACVLVL